MTRAVLTLLILIGAWWSILLTEWVVIGGTGIIGAELNQTMALLPAVAALALLISLYRKLPRLLAAMAALTISASSGLALLGNLAGSPAVIQTQEQVSGIAGGGAVLVEVSTLLYFYSFSGFALALAVASLTFRKPAGVSVETVSQEKDARDLWDEQA